MYKLKARYFNICNFRNNSKLQKIMQYSIRIFSCCIFSFALFSCDTLSELLVPTTQDEGIKPSVDEEVPVKPTEKKGSLEVSVVPKEYYTGLYHYSAEYPTFIQYPVLTKQIEDCIQKRFIEFEKLSGANYQAQIDTMPSTERDAFQKSGKPLYSFFVGWEYGELSHDFISIKLQTYQYAGGANGMIFIDTFNWHPKENAFLTIEDIPSFMGVRYTKKLWLDYLSNNSRFLLENQINRDKNPVISDMILEGSDPHAKNFEHFTIQGNNITLWFEEYQVAAGSFGILSITLPVEE